MKTIIISSKIELVLSLFSSKGV